MINIMIDLETLGSNPTSAIISIGAVKFTAQGVDTTNTFYEVVDIESCIDIGLTIDADTLKWWMKQDESARSVFEHKGHPLTVALLMLDKWIPKGAQIWGNGSDFDNAILANAYRACRYKQPWHFWNNRCYRTLKNQYKNIKATRTGTHHNALDDAITQARHLVDIAQTTGIEL